MRISTSIIAKHALLDLQRAQGAVFDASRQVASQTKAEDMKGYGREAQTLVSSQRLIARIESRMQTDSELSTRLTIQDSALDRAAEIVGELRDSVVQSIGLGQDANIESKMKETFIALKDIFNTHLGGRFVFAGISNSQTPVVAADLNDLETNGTAAAFRTGGQAQTMRLDSVQEVKIAPLAGDVAYRVFDVLRELKVASTSFGAFSGQLNANQKSALQAQMANLDLAFNDMVDAQGSNGRIQNLVSTAVSRQQKQLDALNESVGRVTDADLAEVAVRLQQAQTSYQASASVFSSLRDLSLLQYLR